MFRRHSTDAPTAVDEPEARRDPQAPKGRPTPKRAEATAGRGRMRVPQDRKGAARVSRHRAREEAVKRREGMARGDAKYLPPRDRGPVRAFVRDFIDARTTIAEWFLPVAVVILIFGIMPSAAARTITLLLWALMIVLIVLDSLRITVRLRSELANRFPDENRRGTVAYALLRSLQMRRLRVPKPRVTRGTAL